MRELRLCEYNVENLFLSMEYHAGQDLERMGEGPWRELALGQLRKRQKPLAKVQGVARAILDIDADVVMLVEVGGQDSLDNFSRHFLQDRYDAIFIEGNSRRNIDLGFLIRRGSPALAGWRAEARSNRELPIDVLSHHGNYVSKFSRDVAELRFWEGDQLRLAVLCAHLKSKISTQIDQRGKDIRTAEAIALAGLYDRLRAEHPDVPIALGGDFNAPIGSLELELLKRTDLTDFNDVIRAPIADRATYVYFDTIGNSHPQALDHLLLSPHLVDRVVAAKSFTYRYKSFHDVVEPIVETTRERFRMPSDHYPLVVTVRLD